MATTSNVRGGLLLIVYFSIQPSIKELIASPGQELTNVIDDKNV